MNVFLLYPDRNFDPQTPLPPNAADLTQDLALETLWQAMAQGDKFLFETARLVLLSGSQEMGVIHYRQQILQDCLKNPATVRALYQIPIEAIENKQRHWLGIFSHYPAGILSSAVEMLEMLVGLLHRLRQIADEHAADFESPGFRRFFAMIQQELDDACFAEMEAHLRQLRFREGVLLSAELGPGNEGTNYVLRKPNTPDGLMKRLLSRKSPVYSFTLHPRDDHGARALGELRDRGLNLVANAAAQSADHIDGFLTVLRRELAFYIGALNLYEQLTALGHPVAFPGLHPAEERRHTYRGLYDVCLALTMRKRVVANDGEAEGKDLMLITGANQGGKSTFLRSIGLAQVMMQAGLFVPAEEFSANLCSGIFTHYRREEDASMKSGKLDEELKRMSAIVNHLRPHALVLFNESFAATNEREGAEIARQVVDALLERRVKVFFVTHQYELARGYHERQAPNALFLRAERQPDGSRTYRVRPGDPQPTSHGEDVYRKVFEKER